MKSVEQLLKDLGAATPEKKIEVLSTKLAQSLEECKNTQIKVKTLEKSQQTLLRDKENLQAEHSKAVLSRSRMESLCRELQRQNKAVKEESLSRAREEEERRKEVSNKFQSTLNEVTAMLQQNNERNTKLREENSDMAAKLKLLCDQYAVREQQVEKLAKEYDLERNLSSARVAKLRMEVADEKETMLREKQTLLLELTESNRKCQLLQQELIGVRSQLSLYTEKYEEFQQTLSSSNKTFNGFKEQMDKMTKKLKSLEKETFEWRKKWEASNQALVKLAAEKESREAELANTLKKTVQLEKLCRVLQTERTDLLNRLKLASAPTELDKLSNGIQHTNLDESVNNPDIKPAQTPNNFKDNNPSGTQSDIKEEENIVENGTVNHDRDETNCSAQLNGSE
ncbi:alpha-taxilin-like isoform X2 [Artemia franciscana]|nr:hypothetical protein QYM36_007681 [Artemia franciscana]